MSNPFIEVPEEELAFEPRQFTPPKTGYYTATLEPDASYSSGEGDNGTWECVDIICTGFTTPISDKFKNYKLGGRFYSTNAKGIVNLAKALNIAVKGEGGWRPAAENMEELADQVNSMAGTNVKVYIETGPRRRRTDELDDRGKNIWETVLRDDGQPWVDSKIKSVEPV